MDERYSPERSQYVSEGEWIGEVAHQGRVML